MDASFLFYTDFLFLFTQKKAEPQSADHVQTKDKVEYRRRDVDGAVRKHLFFQSADKISYRVQTGRQHNEIGQHHAKADDKRQSDQQEGI